MPLSQPPSELDNYQGPGIYRHYKGPLYHVLGLGAMEHDKELPDFDPQDPEYQNVIYYPLSRGSMLEATVTRFWVRPLVNFNELVHDARLHCGYYSVPRFTRIDGTL